MHVGRPVAHGLGEDAADDLDDRCVVGDDLGSSWSVEARLRDALDGLEGLDEWSTPPMAR